MKTSKKALALILAAVLMLSAAPFTAIAATEYSDVPPGYWAHDVIAKWSGEGYGVIVGDGNGNFMPKKELSLGEMATLLSKTFGYTDRVETNVSPTWADEYVEKAIAAGVIEKKDTIDASVPVTREQAIKYIALAYNVAPVSGATTFADDGDIGAEYKPYVKAFRQLEYVVGIPGNLFAPKAYYTRAEAMQVLENTTSEITDKSISNQTYASSLIIRKPDVTVKNTTVKENLIVGQGVGDGAVTLEDVTIEGALIAYGGGSNSITVKGTKAIPSMVVSKPYGEAVHIDGEFGTVTVTNGTKAILTGKVAKLVVLGNAEVTLNKAAVTASDVNGDNVKFVASSGSTADTVSINANTVVISGDGSVKNVNVNENAKSGVEVLTVPTKVAVDAKAGAVKTRYNGYIQPGQTLTTFVPSSGGAYEPPTVDDGKYSLNIVASEGGTTSIKSGRYAADDVISISASANEGFVFSGWTCDVGGTFANNAVPDTDFLMPANNVVISAKFLSTSTDTDGDGIENYLEELLGTDPLKADTDQDNLSDYNELYLTQTDPLLKDSDANSILDADEDLDADGLANSIDLDLGLRPDLSDTDHDGLIDGEEVNKYNTNPLLSDTDNDGLTDYEELQLGLDPTKAMTDGITLDSLVTFEQTLDTSAIDEAVISENGWLVPSIYGEVSGLISNNVTIEKSDIDVFDDNRALVSSVLDVNSTYSENLTLAFDYSKSSEIYSGDMNDLVVFSYDGTNMSLLETTVNVGTSTISAVISGEGTYFVMDLNEFLKGIGIDVFRNVSEPETYSTPSSLRGIEEFSSVEPEFITVTDNYGNPIDVIPNPKYNSMEMESPSVSTFATLASDEATTTLGRADVVFVIDKTGSMRSAIDGVQSNINAFADRLVNEYNVDANFALIEYQDITYDGLNSTKLHKSGLSNWFTDVNRFKEEINALVPDDGGDNPETPFDGLGMARGLDWRSNANRFVVLVTDAGYKTNNQYGITSLADMTDKFIFDGVVVSVISANSYTYNTLNEGTGGLWGNIYGNFSDTLLGLADNVGDVTNDGSWILLDDYQAIRLDEPLSSNGHSSDDDGISDRDELNTSYVKDMTREIEYTLNIHGIPMSLYKGETAITLWSYFSNPVLVDTDFDGINDNVDASKRKNSFTGRSNRFNSENNPEYDLTKGKISFDVDYRWFFEDNQRYNAGISVLSSLYAADIYENKSTIENDSDVQIYVDGLLNDTHTPAALLSTFGLKDARVIQVGYQDNDRTEIAVGHRYVEYRGVKQEIILVSIRGTNGTFEEWSSNFDVGADTTEYANITGIHAGSDSEWKTAENHKGFDVTANRVLQAVENYISTTPSFVNDAQKVFWITGHSRGAAIANIVGSYYHKEGRRTFTYTFAAPNTTTVSVSEAQSYRTIFNVLNEDDLIPQLPLKEKWGFTTYGISKTISVKGFYEDSSMFGNKSGTFEDLIDIDYNPTSNIPKLLGKFMGIADNREDLYIHTYANDTLELSGLNHAKQDAAQRECENKNGKLPNDTVKLYGKYEVFEGKNGFGSTVYRVGMYQTPAYFMQRLAWLASRMSITDKIGTLIDSELADKYESARTEFVWTANIGIVHPHWTETYYLIAKNDFKKLK